MHIEEFYIEDLDLHYFVSLNKIMVNKNDLTLTEFFKLIQSIQDEYENVIIQFFNDEYVLNEDHIHSAIYFVQKAFTEELNISQSKNIELLLYLAANRQINQAIQYFGITNEQFNKKELNCCLISLQNNLLDVMDKGLKKLNATKSKFELSANDPQKLERIKYVFKFNDEQIKTVLESYGSRIKTSKTLLQKKDLAEKVFLDLICEQMALLSLEKVKLE